jgi:2,4-dienoyl-CoA reductase-like NADH-dependent reductase (Old Yellow Enzyme family)
LLKSNYLYPAKDALSASVQTLVGLLTPLTVKGVTLRNRIVYPPMQSGRASFQGEVTDKLVNFYVRRSAHVGLPIVEHAYVSALGKIGPRQLGIYSDSLISGFEKLASGLHSVGAPAVVQISHAGAVATKKVIGEKPVGPSEREKSRMLEKTELHEFAEDYALAAERAVKAGFDGVELHGAHGYLLNQFFTPLLNKRTDEFGGSLENRMRFPLMVTEKVRKRIGSDIMLLYRLGSDDLTTQGTNIEESTEFAKRLEAAGIDVLDVSGGMCGAMPKQLKDVVGYFVPQATAVKSFVEAPVVGVGGIKDPDFADALLQASKVDLVAVGRALWHNPQWAQNAAETLRNR